MKAECLVAETSAVQMVVMAGTYGNNDNVPKVTGTPRKRRNFLEAMAATTKPTENHYNHSFGTLCGFS